MFPNLKYFPLQKPRYSSRKGRTVKTEPKPICPEILRNQSLTELHLCGDNNTSFWSLGIMVLSISRKNNSNTQFNKVKTVLRTGQEKEDCCVRKRNLWSNFFGWLWGGVTCLWYIFSASSKLL